MPTTSLPPQPTSSAPAWLRLRPHQQHCRLHAAPPPHRWPLLCAAAIRFDVTLTTGQAANFPATCNLRAADNDAAILLAVCDPPP